MCRGKAGDYLRQPGVTLETGREFVEKAFLLDGVFRELLDERGAGAITVNQCMRTIMGLAETTACLPLSLPDDDGYMALCESDLW